MATSVSQCAQALSKEGVRHHVDDEQAAIRAVFVTRHYHNLRGERLAIVRIETPDEGHRCRVSIERAFPSGPRAAETCMALCRFAADTPLVGVEFDFERDDLRLVAEMPVENGKLASRQLLSMLNRVVEAAEAWYVAMNLSAPRECSTAAKPPRASRAGRRSQGAA